eukprot:15445284-Alexandrium_andersonii.AAC.1
MLHTDPAWAVLQASRGDGGAGRPLVAELYVGGQGTCVLAAMHEPLGRCDGMLAVVLTTAQAAQQPDASAAAAAAGERRASRAA